MDQIRRATILSHDADLDGVASAVLLACVLEHYRGIEVDVVFSNYADAESKLRAALAHSDQVWIADLSWKDHQTELRDALSALGKQNVWFFDHHGSSRGCFEHWEDVATIHFDDSGESCTADVIWRVLRNEIVCAEGAAAVHLEALVRATHSADLWVRTDPNGEYLSDVVSVAGPQCLYNLLMEDPSRTLEENFTEGMRRCVLVAEQKLTKSLEIAHTSKVQTDLCVKVSNGTAAARLTTAICFGRASEVGESLMLVEGAPPYNWVVLLNIEQMAVSVRSNVDTVEHTGIRADVLCEKFGGGGHPMAAGMPLDQTHLQYGPALLHKEMLNYLLLDSGLVSLA